MALEQKLRLKLAQRLVMTPSLQQAIKLLQLSRLELEEALSQEILENPMLEVEDEDLSETAPTPEAQEPSAEAGTSGTPEPEAPSPSQEEAIPEQEAYSDIDVEAFFSDYLGDTPFEGPSMAVPEDSGSYLENIAASSTGLHDHLMWQLHLVDEAPEIMAAGEFIIGNLDDSGFLQVSDEEIAEATGLGAADVQRAMEVVRSLDPPGIGARTLQECLLAQVRVLEKEASDEDLVVLERAREILEHHWDDLLHQRWERIAQELGCEVQDLRVVVEVIQRLDSRPGRQYGAEANFYIEPDVYVRKVGDDYIIDLNDNGLPRLRMNSRYLRMLEGNGLDKKAATFLREKMRNAMWLMKSIDQRQRTIYKVAQSIVEFQRSFLDHGLEHLKPMVLRQVAEDIGMHESTISRVVSNKYIQTPRGIFPMKFFFHSGVDSARGGNVSSLVVKERIRKLIEAEDPERPLSDSKIMKMLQQEGIRLARRTVAKYREELGIPSSEKRKRVF